MIGALFAMALGLALWFWSGDRLAMAANLHRPAMVRRKIRATGFMLRFSGVVIGAIAAARFAGMVFAALVGAS